MTATILIVDDEPVIAQALRIRLESDGYNVIEALSGLEGLRRARHCCPDVIVLDVNMYDLDGFEVRRQLLVVPGLADVPIIYLTAYAVESAKRQAYDPGANIFLAKPFDYGEIRRAIEGAIQRAQSVAA